MRRGSAVWESLAEEIVIVIAIYALGFMFFIMTANSDILKLWIRLITFAPLKESILSARKMSSTIVVAEGSTSRRVKEASAKYRLEKGTKVQKVAPE
jgi:hypothetical protein